MNHSLPAPEGTVWAEQVLTDRYPELAEQSHGIGYAFAVLALSRLAVDINLIHRGLPGIAPVTADQTRAGLILTPDAQQAPRHAELLIAHAAHALGMTWEEVARMRGKKSAASYGKLLERRQAEFGIPTYELPAQPVLGTYHQHAADLLDATLADRPVNPHQRSGAADLLTVLLFLRSHARRPAHLILEWVENDDLAPALAAAEEVDPGQAAPARKLLNQHIGADVGFRAAVARLVTPALVRLQFQEEEDQGIVRCRVCTGQIELPDGPFVNCPGCGEPDPAPSLRQDLIDAQRRTL